MSKVAAVEEMYLIYQAFRDYLADPETWVSMVWTT